MTWKMDRRQGGSLGVRSHGRGHSQEQSTQNEAMASITASLKAGPHLLLPLTSTHILEPVSQK